MVFLLATVADNLLLVATISHGHLTDVTVIDAILTVEISHVLAIVTVSCLH